MMRRRWVWVQKFLLHIYIYNYIIIFIHLKKNTMFEVCWLAKFSLKNLWFPSQKTRPKTCQRRTQWLETVEEPSLLAWKGWKKYPSKEGEMPQKDAEKFCLQDGVYIYIHMCIYSAYIDDVFICSSCILQVSNCFSSFWGCYLILGPCYLGPCRTGVGPYNYGEMYQLSSLELHPQVTILVSNHLQSYRFQ